MLQIEMIEHEIEQHGMLRMAAFLDNQGFDMYFLHAQSFDGSLPTVLSSEGTRVDDTPAQLKRGFVLYGENALSNFTLSPGLASSCDKGISLWKDRKTFLKRLQHVFIRRGTAMHGRVVKRYGGVDENNNAGACHLRKASLRGGEHFCLVHKENGC